MKLSLVVELKLSNIKSTTQREFIEKSASVSNKVDHKSLRHFLLFNFLHERSLDNSIQIVLSIALRVDYKNDVQRYLKDNFLFVYEENIFLSSDQKFKALFHMFTLYLKNLRETLFHFTKNVHLQLLNIFVFVQALIQPI